MKLINLTPHNIVLNSGEMFPVLKRYPAARVSAELKEEREVSGIKVYSQKYGQIINLPERRPGTLYIVSGIVLAAAKVAGRNDCVAPATSHTEVVRDKNGHIVSVPGFVM